MERLPHPAGAGRTRDDARESNIDMKGTQLCVWVATNGTKTVPAFSEGEAEAYCKARRDRAEWRVEPWVTTFTRPLVCPTPVRSRLTR